MTDLAPPFAFTGLERIFHEPARLGIVTSLASKRDGVRFSDLKRLCGLTDGNLNRHLQALDAAGFVMSSRESHETRSLTRYHLTDLGRERFLAYLSALEDALREAAEAAESPEIGLATTSGNRKPSAEPG